jgi:8-oxo-dGTP pyrophosphatase MutT (NUDIX family)
MDKRYRATVLIIKDGKVLLVRDKGKRDYSMPGGGFKPKETTLQAGIREVFEELKLNTTSAERLRYCDFEGQRANHKVCLLKVEGTPRVDSKELEGYIWWDMNEDIPIQGHVKKILFEYKKRNLNFNLEH